ncbi:MAG: response regulator [bacterium]|nr:response regulator [bacterium]
MADILVIEDNRANLDLMAYLLRAFGHDVTALADPLEAWRVAQERRFDVIVSDVLMPGMDGLEFAARCKANEALRSTPLVAVTALAMVGDRERVLAAGFDGYVPKPIDPQTFVAQIQGFVASRESERERADAAPLVLAVDDVAVNLEVIEGTLRPCGFRVAIARNGSEALAAIAKERPAVILSDLHMPGGDGFTLIQSVKNDPALAQIPFLFISSTGWRTADQLRGLTLGAAKFLIRPIEPQRLIEEVRAAVAQAGHGEDPHP